MHLGLDCSTQSFSAILIDAENGSIAHEASVNFEKDLPHYGTTAGFVRGPNQGEVFSNPLMWVEALELLLGKLAANGAPLAQVSSISGSGQQHATVYLNEQFPLILDTLQPEAPLHAQLGPSISRLLSPIWMDGSTANECEEIASALGSHQEVCRRSGSVAIQRFSGPQIRKFAKQDPIAWGQTKQVHLASSFLASILAGKPAAIDHGDGAGMNLMNLEQRGWDSDLVQATAPDLLDKLPPLASSSTVAGKLAPYFVKKYGFSEQCDVVLWSGDNPCSLVGMGASSPGNLVISLGTSYTLFAAMESPHTDPQGFGHVFGNPLGGFMSLICFQNGALACEATKQNIKLSWTEFDARTEHPPKAGDTPSLPFFQAEITPLAKPSEQSNTTVRSLLDGQFLSMKKHADWMRIKPKHIRVTGGISRAKGICQTIANVFNSPVQTIETHASAGLGAAMRACLATTNIPLNILESSFCQPESDSILPQPEVSAIYQEMSATFDTMLTNHLNS
ncbi:carbohydrate kinase [Verrucomicrobiaceae bacterium N1E253]|uniref:Carbohydrate kinase n=1 Tax=Oceaniferula marina TaxID=2748318 RepID=A0A851GHZ1_9BACT|nr:FGGY family carbohydrate kinase [Oceaniferula marina]NWK57398.1 carbohydrate kinase [Oceaniferula marina]